MEPTPVIIAPDEERRLIAETQAILDGSGFEFKITGITAKSVGVMGDGRTHEYGIVITPQNAAACDTPLHQRLGTKIINEVRGINRTTFEVPLTF